MPNIIMYGGVKNGVLYRKQYFDFHHNFQGGASIDLADFPVANGHIRVDKMRIPNKPFTLTMGAYGFPEFQDETKTQVIRRSCEGAQAVILKQAGRQLALVAYTAWESVETKERRGVNPAAENSILAYGKLRREKMYGYEPYVMISAVLSRNDDGEWEEDELFPVREITFMDEEQCGGYGPVTLLMTDGRTVVVDFEGLEGHLMI